VVPAGTIYLSLRYFEIVVSAGSIYLWLRYFEIVVPAGSIYLSLRYFEIVSPTGSIFHPCDNKRMFVNDWWNEDWQGRSEVVR
jgi:hypothetical protein